jgi:hypothetical protein
MVSPVVSSDIPSPAVRFVLGLLFIAGGVVCILAAFDIGPMGARDINGPPWLGAATGSVFVVGGVFLWFADAAARHPLSGTLVAAGMLTGFAAIGNWIAFGAGPRECSGGVSGFIFISPAAAELECRAAFGIGALLVDGFLLLMLATGLRGLGIEGRVPSWIGKIGKGMLLVALAPIVLVLIVGVIGKSLFEAFVTYWRTGTWPRNEAFIARKKKEAETRSG